jgi:hypothetical protein
VQTYDIPLRSPDRIPTTRDLTVTEEALTRVRGSSSPDQPRYTLAKKPVSIGDGCSGCIVVVVVL